MNGQLDPALIQQILSAEDPADDPEAQQQMQLQALATKLRAGIGAPQSQGQMAGQVFLPNGISNAAGSIAGAMGSKMAQGQATEMGKGLTQKRTNARSGYFQALGRALKGSAGAGGMSPETTGFPEALARQGVGNMQGLEDEGMEY